MSWQDITNGIYEMGGGIFMLLNCIQTYIDKQVKGISIISMIFFCSWGYWNLYYYPSLNQWMSAIGAAVLCVFNTIWICMAIHYTRKERILKVPTVKAKQTTTNL